MNKMKMNKRYVKSALKIFILSVMVIVLVHSVFEGYGLRLDYTISRYVGLDYWSWIAFATCNVVVCELAFRYLAGVKNEWGMSLGWWIAALWMLVMLLGLSFFPVGLFDETWGDYGVVSQVHQATSWMMFALAVVTIALTIIRFREEKLFCKFGFFMVIYGILLGGSIFLGIELAKSISLLVEWGFIVMYLVFLLYIPYFKPGTKRRGMDYVHNKLVRDKIPEIISKDNQVPVTRILSKKEYQVELERKMLEEQREVTEAKGADKIEELADLLELIRADAELNGSSLEEVTKVADKKKAKRGGFSQRIYLEKVIDK